MYTGVHCHTHTVKYQTHSLTVCVYRTHNIAVHILKALTVVIGREAISKYKISYTQVE